MRLGGPPKRDGGDGGVNLNGLLCALGADSRARLRWRVIRELGIIPGSREERRLSDTDCLTCGLNMLLDMGEAQGSGEGNNPEFDERRFARLKKVGGGGI